ncbi:peroxiredoxin-like family protein [Flavobacterium arcticum]|nr:peroxiredoxin-like family protein [Flavobacterium arcticum]
MKKISYALCISTLLLMSCNTSKKDNNETMETKEETVERTLKANLDTKKANFEEKASDEKKKIYAEGIQSVVDSKIVENALQVGDTAMNFTLKNASNEEVNLYDELEKGPVVLMWYRGGWCPYCNLTLQYMQQSLPEFKEQGANLLALTPELPDSSISTKEKNELEFQVLSDIDNKVAKEYKVVYKLTDDVAKSYENSFELSKYNGNDDAELPLAATYVIGKDKVIKYAFLDAEYRNRAEPKDIIAALKKLNTK